MTATFDTVEDIKKHIVDQGFHISRISRMNCSSGVLNIIDVNDTFSFDAGCWTSYWTKKYNELSYDDFVKWATPKLVIYVIDKISGDTHVGCGGWYDLKE